MDRKGVVMEQRMDRREFVKRSALGASSAAMGAMYVPERAFGANDRIPWGLSDRGAGLRR